MRQGALHTRKVLSRGGMNDAPHVRGRTLVAMLTGLVLALSPLGNVNAGHTIGWTSSHVGGDCWRSGTPLFCRNTWSGANTKTMVRVIVQTGSQRPGWTDEIYESTYGWHNLLGNRIFALNADDLFNDTWVYYKYTQDGATVKGLYIDPLLNINAVTFNCKSGYCTYQNNPFNVVWSEIYLNASQMDTLGYTRRRNVDAHEMGHALGMSHHNNQNVLMYPFDTTIQGPTSTEVGPLPVCGTSIGAQGVRCIYEFTNP
jgi:hypothetical protein